MSLRTLLSAVGGVVVDTVREAIVNPVQAGRVEIRVWPGHMRAIIIAAYVVYAAIVLSVLLSPFALARGPDYNEFGLSAWGMLPVVVGLWASMVLLFLASLHLHVLWRLGAWLLLAVPHIIAWLSGLALIGMGPNPFLSLFLSVMSAGLGVVLLVVVMAIGSRGPIRVGTMVLAVVALGLSYLVPQLLSLRVPQIGSFAVSVTAIALMILAMPLAVAAGTAFAQIAVNVSTSTVDSIRRRAPSRLWPILAPIVGVAVLVMPLLRNLDELRDPDSGVAGLLITIGFTIVGAGLSAAGLILANRRARRLHSELGTPMSYPRPLVLSEILADVSMVLGILLGSWGITMLLGLIVPLPALLRDRPAEFADFLMAAAALVLAIRAIVRGRTAAAVLLPPVMLMGVYGGLRAPLGLPTLLGSVSAATLAIGLGIVAVSWIRRGGGQHRWFILCLGMVILFIFPFREEIAEPLEALLGSTQVGVLLFGLIWLLLTEAEFTHRASPRFGRSSRTLVFLAYALFTAVMMAAVAYATDDSIFRSLHLGELASIGDAIIGFAVAPAVIVGLMALGHRDIDPVDGSPEPRPPRKVHE